MNPLQLVQAAIIIAAVMLGYHAIYYLIEFAVAVVHDLPESDYGRIIFDFRRYTLAPGVGFLGYATALFLLLKHAYKISYYITRKIGVDDSFRVSLSDRTFIGMAILYTVFGSLIKNIPILILDSIIMIQESMAVHYPDIMYHPEVDAYDIISLSVQILFCIMILVKIKTIVDFFHRKINPVDPYVVDITGQEE